MLIVFHFKDVLKDKEAFFNVAYLKLTTKAL